MVIARTQRRWHSTRKHTRNNTEERGYPPPQVSQLRWRAARIFAFTAAVIGGAMAVERFPNPNMDSRNKSRASPRPRSSFSHAWTLGTGECPPCRNFRTGCTLCCGTKAPSHHFGVNNPRLPCWVFIPGRQALCFGQSGGGCKSWIGGVNPGVLFRASDCSFVAAIVEHRDSPLRKSSALDSHETFPGNEGGGSATRHGAADQGQVTGGCRDRHRMTCVKLPATCRLPLV